MTDAHPAMFCPLRPGDFLCLKTRVFQWPDGYVYEYRLGRVRLVDGNHAATGFTDHAGVSRAVGKETHPVTWGVPAYKVRADDLWDAIVTLGDSTFDNLEDAIAFVRPYLLDAAIVSQDGYDPDAYVKAIPDGEQVAYLSRQSWGTVFELWRRMAMAPALTGAMARFRERCAERMAELRPVAAEPQKVTAP